MDILEQVREKMKGFTGNSYSLEEKLQMECDRMNEAEGFLDGEPCPKCRNKRVIYFVEDGYVKSRQCQCYGKWLSMIRIKNSGLKDLYYNCTLETFHAVEEWQKGMLSIAQRFLKNPKGKWMFAGGQPGAGKTHICTAVVRELMESGYPARYMVWPEELVKIKANLRDEEAYSRTINPWKTVDVLYIDDFFKTKTEADLTPTDIKIAFEIINYRYNNRDLITVISSEKAANQIVGIDEALGSRILERAKDCTISIKNALERNYRIKWGWGK